MSRYLGFTPAELESGYYFISYNNQDANRIQPLVMELFKSGMPLWYDYALKYSQEWQKQIARKIDGANAVILFLTKGVVEKDASYVRKEYDMATQYFNKTVFVVKLDNIRNSDIPVDSVPWYMEVNMHHIIDLTEVTELTQQIGLICTALGFAEKAFTIHETQDTQYSKGLEFQKLDNGAYAVTGMGTCQDRELKIPPTTPEGGKVKRINDKAFENQIELVSVTIPDSVTSIGNSAFYKCCSLAEVTIPNSTVVIENYAFGYCNGLSAVSIPKGVIKVGNFAFYNCRNLTSVIIPSTVTDMGSHAFDDCVDATIYCERPSKPGGWDKYWNPDNQPVIWNFKQ